MEFVWTALNCVALVGWAVVLVALARADPADGALWTAGPLKTAVVLLEGLCCVDVVRMLVGNLRGNKVMGVVLHYSRMFVCANAFRNTRDDAVRMVLYAWAITEVCRYPAYIWKSSSIAQKLRYGMPMLTFPLGVSGEVLAVWFALPRLGGGVFLLACAQLGVNVLGGLAAYPGLVKKGLKTLYPPKPKPIAGVQFPVTNAATAERSTTVTGKRVWAAVANALGDAALAARIASERDWRYGYAKHVKAVAAATLRASAKDAVAASNTGLATVNAQLEFVRDGKTTSIPDAVATYKAPVFSTATIKGGAQLPAESLRIGVPLAGRELWGASLVLQLEAWVRSGEMEADTAATLTSVISAPGRLDLRDKCFVVFGASSEVGPCRHLLRLGATVAAVGTRRAGRWAKLIAFARSTPGTMLVPVVGACADDSAVCENAGADLMTQTPEIATWLKSVVFAPLTIGCYTYLDGDKHVRVNAACEAISHALLATAAGEKASLHYLCSPATAHPFPPAALAAAAQAAVSAAAWQKNFENWGVLQKNAEAPVATPGGLVALFDGLLTLQGPNYALAKHMQMWRAVAAKAEGRAVSSPMAPAVRTDSMMHVMLVAAGLRGGPYFGTQSYSPELTSAVMALLLVAHLTDANNAHASPAAKLRNPTEMFALDGFTGGMWRSAYTSESAGPFAALLGFVAPFKLKD
ncbi:hypothetical protein M885DRAFT_626074 [Pelagophyceae sp. CCMP2097]|nr:hypothetical protein M885DRAFT_626074 [Pelagophyceae sp. CCMP2097]